MNKLLILLTVAAISLFAIQEIFAVTTSTIIDVGNTNDNTCAQGRAISTRKTTNTINVACQTFTPTATKAAAPTATNTPVPTATSTPVLVTPTATSTATNTPIAVSTDTPLPTPTSTNTPASGGSGCVTNCGTPRFYCDQGGFAFCDDYRDLFCSVPTGFLTECPFQPVRSNITVNTFSSSDPGYLPIVDKILTNGGWFFNQQEHFHSEVYDQNFGQAIERLHQPIDISSTRHIHFEVDLKTSARRYVRFTLSPELTKATVDDRYGAPRPPDALDIWFINGTFVGNVYKAGSPFCVGGCGNAFHVTSPRYYGVDNIRDVVDAYVSRTHVTILVNGITYVNTNITDVGFDVGYLYLVQASYNPCKDNQCSENLQIFHWDNVSFDGPVLAKNGLTPDGMQDVLFNAYGQASCKVKGVTAQSVGEASGYTWLTWVARMSIQSVTPADVSCVNGSGGQFWNDTGRTPEDFEVVHQ